MRVHATLKWFVALAVLGYAPSPADAQSGGAGGSAEGSGTVGFSAPVAMTPAAELAQAEATVTFVDQAAKTVSNRLQAARQQKDVVKMLCLNDKLSQIDVAARTVSERKAQLASAAGRNDGELANHEFTILTVIKQRVEQLMTEANQCVGEEASYTGASTTFSVDPNQPGGDVTPPPWAVGVNDPNNPGSPIVAPPVYSPHK
jgi:hypothetical protein